MTFPRAFIFFSSLLLIEPAVSHAAPLPPPAASDLVHQLNDAYIHVFEKVAPSVVVIEVKKSSDAAQPPASPLDLFKPQAGPEDDNQNPAPSPDDRVEGSGIICRADGYIYTNSHVVEDAGKITVTFKDGRKFPAKVIGNDSWSDVAVIKIEATDLPVPEFADSDQVRVGQLACVIGAPYDYTYSFTTGVVSAKGRNKILDQSWSGQFEDFIQTDASINPGNSGGPLLDIDGRVIGMNTLIQGLDRGLGFAISSNMLRKMGEQIISAGKIARPWLGLTIASLGDLPGGKKNFDPLDHGVVVRSIREDTPAFHSDLRPDDVILKVDDAPVAESIDLQKEIQKKKIGQTIQLRIWRQGKELTIPVVTAELPGSLVALNNPPDGTSPPDDETEKSNAPTPKTPDGQNQSGLGLEVQTLTPELASAQKTKAQKGAIVTDVQQGSPAELAGLQIGDIITEINAQPVTDAKALAETLRNKDLRKGVLLFIERSTGSSYLVLKDSR